MPIKHKVHNIKQTLDIKEGLYDIKNLNKILFTWRSRIDRHYALINESSTAVSIHSVEFKFN